MSDHAEETGGAAAPARPASEKTDEEWRRELTPEQYRILRKKGTERAFTGEHWDTKTPGMYACAGCGQELFDAEHKLVYRGQLDDTRPHRISSGNYDARDGAANGKDLRAAIDQVLAGQAVTVEQVPSMGCNIKWR